MAAFKALRGLLRVPLILSFGADLGQDFLICGVAWGGLTIFGV